MQVSYKKLWKLLIDKEMNKSDLQEKAGISWTSVTKMSKNKNVSMEVLNKEEKVAYMPLNGFTTVDIGCDRGNNAYNMVNRMESPFTEQYMQIFDNIWNDTSSIRPDSPDITGIYQGFRCVGSQSKLGADFPVKAYKLSENRYTLEDIKASFNFRFCF